MAVATDSPPLLNFLGYEWKISKSLLSKAWRPYTFVLTREVCSRSSLTDFHSDKRRILLWSLMPWIYIKINNQLRLSKGSAGIIVALNKQGLLRYERTSGRSSMAYWGNGGCDQYFSEQNSDPIRVEFHSLEHTSMNELRLMERKSMDAGPRQVVYHCKEECLNFI